MTNTKTRFHGIISGRVQGVTFRDTTKRKADSLGITGWVMNRHDGTVEVVAEGTPQNMKQFINYLGDGPPAAQVNNIREINEQATGEFETFTVTYATRR